MKFYFHLEIRLLNFSLYRQTSNFAAATKNPFILNYKLVWILVQTYYLTYKFFLFICTDDFLYSAFYTWIFQILKGNVWKIILLFIINLPISCNFPLKKIFIHFWRDGKVGRKRGKETSVCDCLSHTPNWAPGMCPAWEWNRFLFGSQVSA